MPASMARAVRTYHDGLKPQDEIFRPTSFTEHYSPTRKPFRPRLPSTVAAIVAARRLEKAAATPNS